MKVLLIGSGGREHAIAKALLNSPQVDELICAPGNAGMAQIARVAALDIMDNRQVVAFAAQQGVDWVFVAPDDPLANGLADALRAAGIAAFGPSAKAARIEASKSFAKGIMAKAGIPTGSYRAFTGAGEAKEYIRGQGAPIVVKADGLALGKGVFVCMNTDEALAAVDAIMVDGAFGEAGATVVVEEYMQGPEASVLCFSDGRTVKLMPAAQDHKRIFDGDLGGNTGGMGAFAPTPKLSQADLDFVKDAIIQPCVDALRAEGCPFKGVLFAGIMMTEQGIRVIEFNARLGDPETQVILPLLRTDLVDIMRAVEEEKLADIDIQWDDRSAAVVVMASQGYPGKYQKGAQISGIDQAQSLEDTTVYHAGTACKDGAVVTSGGRVLGVTALGETLAEAINRAYRGVECIRFEGAQYRRDIGRQGG